MEKTKSLKATCPNCKKQPGSKTSSFRPFCCERCKTEDLSKWADGSYSIPSQDFPSSEDNFEKDSNSF